MTFHTLVRVTLLLFAGLHGSASLAGAWDVGPFDNDDAMDFVLELEQQDGLQGVYDAFIPTYDPEAYLEVDLGARCRGRRPLRAGPALGGIRASRRVESAFAGDTRATRIAA